VDKDNQKITQQKAEYYTDLAIQKGYVCDDHKEWIERAMECADLNHIGGRELFHKISATSKKYEEHKAEKVYNDVVKKRRGERKIGSWFRHCTDVLHIPKFKSTSVHRNPKESANATTHNGFTHPSTDSLLDVRMCSDFMAQALKRPIPQKLFRELWYEGELCILFADTNTGKSILAVSMCEEISRSQKVMYCDFELSDKQFQIRYTNDAGSIHKFNDNFFRAEINPDANLPEGQTFEEFLNDSLEAEIKKSDIKVVVIDNITYLRSQTEKSHEALPLMKSLKRLKQKYHLSILCLAHTPKRDMTKPISKNDLQGSKMLINFCDSSFAIGESMQDKTIRYLKQIKARNTEIIYDTDNVITCQLKKDDTFLKFEMLGFGKESDHLMQLSDKQKEDRIGEALEMKKKGMSNVEIGKKFNVSEGAVRKWIKKGEDPSYTSYPSYTGSNGTSSTSQHDKGTELKSFVEYVKEQHGITPLTECPF